MCVVHNANIFIQYKPIYSHVYVLISKRGLFMVRSEVEVMGSVVKIRTVLLCSYKTNFIVGVAAEHGYLF